MALTIKYVLKTIVKFAKKPSLVGLLSLMITLGMEFYSHEFHDRDFISHQVRVVDGDTIVLTNKARKRTLRLQGIDAPELKQSCAKYVKGRVVEYPCGQQAKDYLIDFIDQRVVSCTDEGRDKYGRQLSYCFVDNVNINRLMVRQGYAVAYISFDISFMFEEWVARFSKQGLWRGLFENPSDWRKQQRNS